jgi:GNAT superfamily N-acetyltransferase
MMDWTLLRLPDLRGDSTDAIGVLIDRHDAHQPAILTELGLVDMARTLYNVNFQRLEGPIEVPALPEGFTVVTMNERANLDERVAVHREVWAPSTFTRAGYDELRQAPVYRTDLDLAVQAPDGRYAAYLIAWFDPQARTLLLEPVGTRAEFRRRGLSRALILETLRRASELGADRVWVLSAHDDLPSNALYLACGFRQISGDQWWQFPVPESTN